MSHNSPATVHFSRDSPFIFIFPRFWNYPSVPSASPSTCLTVVPHFNNYKQNGEDYISYQLWILRHEFIHHYTYDYSPEVDREIFFVNDCLRLPASKAIGNPQSYIFYVASEFFNPLSHPLAGFTNQGFRPNIKKFLLPTHCNSTTWI